MDSLSFKSVNDAIQELADLTGSRIIVASENWYQLPDGDALMKKIEAIYELEYKYHALKNNPGKWTGMPKRHANTMNKMEELIRKIASSIANDLIVVFDRWLSKHALLSADRWTKGRMQDYEETGDDDYIMEGAMSEYDRYIKGGNFDEDFAGIIDESINESHSLKQFLIEYGQEEQNHLIEQKEEEEEEYKESDFDYLNDPKEVWEHILNSWGAEEAMNNVLPDYVKKDLAFSVYKHLVFPAWLSHWKREGIEKTRKRVEDTTEILRRISSKSISKVGDITVGINRALNEAHQTGEMMEYIGEEHDISEAELDDLSNRDVSDWDKELSDMGLKAASKRFSNKAEAIQYLSEYAGKRIIIK